MSQSDEPFIKKMAIISNTKMVDLANRLIERPIGRNTIIKENYDTNDIVSEIKAVNALPSHRSNTRRFAPWLLKGIDQRATLFNLWKFVKENIPYKADGDTFQAVKTPAASWHYKLADCKGYSLFISSVLKNLNIPHYYQFAGYDRESNRVTHVYIKVPTSNGTYTLDACMPHFNAEKPYVVSQTLTP